MGNLLKFVVPLGVFAALIAFLYAGLQRDNARIVPSPLIGKSIPDFALPRVHAADKKLTKADFVGRVSLLNVWASWCVSCREEHPLLVEVARQKMVPIFGLNYKDEVGDAVQWLGRLGDPYTASGSDFDGRVGLDLGVYGVPETFLIDKRGNIAYKHIGPITPEAWQTKILPKIQSLQNEG